MSDTMTREPRFSIALPAYNSGGMLSETLDSVIAQTFTDWELVIVDDGSSDSTGAIADEYAARDPRIRVIHQANAGCGPARSTAIENARAQLVARLDQDDTYVPTYLEEMARFIEEHPDFHIYSCNGEKFFPDGRSELYHNEPEYEMVMCLTFDDMVGENGIFSPAIFRKVAYEAVGGIRYGVYAEDYDLWLRMIASGSRHIYLPKALVRYRVSGGQMSGDRLLLWESALEVLHNLRKSGVLDRKQGRLVRSVIRQYWQWRAWNAFEAARVGGLDGRPPRDYFPARGKYSLIRRITFVFLALSIGLSVHLERFTRVAVSSAIALLRRALPFLKEVRIRRGPEQ